MKDDLEGDKLPLGILARQKTGSSELETRSCGRASYGVPMRGDLKLDDADFKGDKSRPERSAYESVSLRLRRLRITEQGREVLKKRENRSSIGS